VILSRWGDILTTYLGSPNLLLEANPLMKKCRGWKFIIFINLLPCILAFYSPMAAIMLIIASLWVAYDNSKVILRVKTFGEKIVSDQLAQMVTQNGVLLPILCALLSVFFLFCIGGLIIYSSFGNPNLTRAIGAGIILFGFMSIFYKFLDIYTQNKTNKRPNHLNK
jgi:hypothetical protein